MPTSFEKWFSLPSGSTPTVELCEPARLTATAKRGLGSMTGGEFAGSASMDARTFSVTEAIAFGWDTFKRNMAVSIGIGAGSISTMLILNGLAESAGDHPVLVMGIGFVSQLVQIFWSLVWIRFALSVYDARVLRPRELVADSKTYVEFLAVTLLYGLLVAAGLLLLIVPGIYLAVRYGLVGFLVADGRADVLDSFRQSSAVTKGVRWRLFFLMLLLVVLNLGGALFLGLGLLFTVPTSVFAMALAYRRLAARVELEMAPLVTPPAPVSI
jgi:hypothetical protein